MPTDRNKTGNRPTKSSQFDLFSPAAQPTAQAGISAAFEARSVEADSGNALADAVRYVLGPRKQLGRPPKILNAVGYNSEARLLDVREAARWLGLSKSTLDKMRCSGRGPRYIRASARAIRYDPADLTAFAEARGRYSTSEDAPTARRE
jgi:predicted DNA-binding transcriptional regulator AlpA